MTIDQLGEGTILVSLAPEDMSRYELDFSKSYAGADTRRGLTRLMVRVGEECGLDHKDKSYLIEALPGGDGCLLIISVRKKRRVFRIKREKIYDCCRFDTADELLDWFSGCELAKRLSYVVYRCEERYCLIPDLPLTSSQSALMSEYGRLSRESAVTLARVSEFGRPVLKHTYRRRHAGYVSAAAI